MSDAATIRLITETDSAHGVHEAITEDKRLVLCAKRSVRLSEYYAGQNTGFAPELTFVLAAAEDYHGESRLEYNGKTYDVIRTYETKTGGLEITVQREDVNERTSQ